MWFVISPGFWLLALAATFFVVAVMTQLNKRKYENINTQQNPGENTTKAESSV